MYCIVWVAYVMNRPPQACFVSFKTYIVLSHIPWHYRDIETYLSIIDTRDDYFLMLRTEDFCDQRGETQLSSQTKMKMNLLETALLFPMLLMRTTKTAVCLQTKAIFMISTFMGFNWCSTKIPCVILYQ